MENFEETYIVINNVKMAKLIDTNGLAWYPLNYFLEKVLGVSLKAKNFTDTNLENFMQVIEFQQENAHRISKTWFMNEWGIRHLLENIQPLPTEKDKHLRIDSCCIYFNVERNERRCIYAKLIPNQKDYSPWEYLVLKNDKRININTVWKRCDYCDKFFPDNKYYFNIVKTKSHKTPKTKHTCLQCTGDKFSIPNKSIEIMYEKGGDKIVQAYIEKNVMKLFTFMNKTKANYKIDVFNTSSAIRELFEELPKHPFLFNMENYNIIYVSNIINVPPDTIKRALDNFIQIGYYETRKEHRDKGITKTNLIKMVKSNFEHTIEAKKLQSIDCEPIIGIITSKGLNIIAKKIVKCPYANIYLFDETSERNMQTIIKRIKNQGG